MDPIKGLALIDTFIGFLTIFAMWSRYGITCGACRSSHAEMGILSNFYPHGLQRAASSGEFDIVRRRKPRQQGGRDNSMSSHSIHTQSNSALHDAPRASATVGLFDQAMVTAVVIAIAYIASIMVGWL
jgi:hypothetical protein